MAGPADLEARRAHNARWADHRRVAGLIREQYRGAQPGSAAAEPGAQWVIDEITRALEEGLFVFESRSGAASPSDQTPVRGSGARLLELQREKEGDT